MTAPAFPSHGGRKLFVPFTAWMRPQSAKRRLGAGLAIARDIARAHGGDILLGESTMGGLKATVRLPVNRPKTSL